MLNTFLGFGTNATAPYGPSTLAVKKGSRRNTITEYGNSTTSNVSRPNSYVRLPSFAGT